MEAVLPHLGSDVRAVMLLLAQDGPHPVKNK